MVYLLVGILCMALGAALGWIISNLKKKSEMGGLTERLSQEQQKLEEAKSAFAKAQQETTNLRKEKDFFQNELTSGARKTSRKIY